MEHWSKVNAKGNRNASEWDDYKGKIRIVKCFLILF